MMDNNKGRKNDRQKSNPELRRMEPKTNADLGITNGHKISVHNGNHEKSE